MLRLRHVLPLLPLVLAACNSHGESAPSGQVVAKVAGDDVTVGELNAELVGVRLPTGADRAAIERQAVQSIVERKLLAHEATTRKLDENPAYLLQKRRTDELLLVQMLRDQIASSVPKPSTAEAETYVQEHPTLFSNRRLYILDQIQFPVTTDQEMIKKISATQTMDDLEQLLISSGIEYRRAPSSLDTVSAPVDIAARLTELPQGEVFVVRQGSAFIANRIVETRTTPFSGEKAIEFAQNRLRAERIQKRLQAEAKSVQDKGKTLVTYQDKYKPQPQKAAASTPAAATGK